MAAISSLKVGGAVSEDSDAQPATAAAKQIDTMELSM